MVCVERCQKRGSGNLIRDLEIIRYILLEVEKADDYNVKLKELAADASTRKTISHHINLLIDSGYIEATKTRNVGNRYEDFLIKRITSSGYDYLDNVRNNQVWEETKKQIVGFGSSVSLDVVKTVSGKIILGLLGI
jgi:predicted transcriptional regulator